MLQQITKEPWRICCALYWVHEWYTHGYYKVGDAYNNHNLAYKNILNDKEFYPKTTSKYKEFIKGQYQYYKQKEQKNK